MNTITHRRSLFRNPSYLLASLLISSSTPASVIHVVNKTSDEARDEPDAHPYLGEWATDDGFVRHRLLPNGRYDEARGDREHAYQGSYVIHGNHVDYVDDAGFIEEGEFCDGLLYHAGLVLRRPEQA
ncbi:Atu4866 domain-containing protein [Chitinimonas naiadis]